jgi:GT2 family glycosyltransferase
VKYSELPAAADQRGMAHRATISPPPAGMERPLWSVMIPTYNCAGYLRETLETVLSQDPGPERMQIEVVDDCSTLDDPERVVREVAGGRVAFYRQPTNVGHVANFNTCLQRSTGRLVHLLHGDDQVRSGFYDRLGSAFKQAPEVGAAFCRHLIMDETGHWMVVSKLEQHSSGVLSDWFNRIAIGQRLQAPSIAVRREVYERLGGFDSRIRYYGEDWEMWVRIAAHYPVWYEPEPLAVYRLHTASLSGRTVRTGENGADLRRAIDLNRQWTPADHVERIARAAREANAHGCLRRAFRLANAGERTASLAQLRESLRFSRAPSVVASAAAVGGVWVLRALLPTKSEP